METAKMQVIPGVAQLYELDLPTARFTRLEGDIVWMRYKNLDEEITIDEARKHTEVLQQFGGANPLHAMIDFREIHVTFSNEAREHFRKAKHILQCENLRRLF